MKTVAPWVVWVKPSWRRFAQHFTRFGDASLAAEHVGYRGSNARHQGVALMTKPEVLLACFEEIERRRQDKGPAPHEDAVRKLIDAAAECLRPGETRGRSARLLPNLQPKRRSGHRWRDGLSHVERAFKSCARRFLLTASARMAARGSGD
jgi:hypothetical protein